VAADEGKLVEATRRLSREPGRALVAEQRRLDGLAAVERALRPERMLARGWTLTYAGERLVRGPGDVVAGDRIRTQTARGDIGSVVEEGHGDADD
jgi:exodeoxyribonuclease VII large subunit